MFKFAIKIGILSLIVLAASMMSFGSGKASADSCPNSFSDAQNNHNWGVTPQFNGAHGGNMAGMIVHAYDASNNQNIDTGYTLHSGISSTDPDNGVVNGNPVNLNARIWQDNQGQFSNRTNTYPSKTNSFIGPSGVHCTGWDAFGPNDPSNNNVGNGYVLDCGPQAQPTHFWLSDISPLPAGDGDNGLNGYWSVNVVDTYNGENFTIDHYSEGSMTFSSHDFTVTNGLNVYVNLIWHPQPPNHNPPDLTSECYGIDVTDGGGATINNKSFNSGDIRTLVNVQDSSGRVLVDGSTGGVSYSISGAPNGSSWGVLQDTELNHPFVVPVSGKVLNVYVFRQYYHNTGTKDRSGNWIYAWDNIPAGSTDGGGNPLTGDQSRSHNCYAASCTVTQVDGNVPGGYPSNGVLAGSSFTVHVSVTNTGDSTYLPLNSPTVNDVGIDGFWLPLEGGDSGPAIVSATADAAVENQTLTFTVKDSEVHDEGSGLATCTVKVPVYQQFSATVSAQSDPLPTIENPSSDNYGATITHYWPPNAPAGLPAHAINNPTSASFYQKKAGGGQTTPCSPSSYSSSASTTYTVPSPNPPGNESVWSHSCAIAPGSFAAGDEFCSTVTATYSGGYLGPDNNVVDGTGPATDTKCPRVVNEPYFKVYNSDISAGGDFDQCTTNGGTLAGYADISDPAGATRGSTTQLSALALLKITGVASAKTSADIIGSPTKLTFANTGVQVDSSGNESPVLGGQFGGCRTLTNETAPASAQNLAGNSTGAVPTAGPGAYTHTGNLTISGGTLGTNQNVSIFVTGNVYISGNITYGNGWGAGTAPSFIVHATGNIYIAGKNGVNPGVTQLTGLYIAQQANKLDGTPDTTTGKIYTCADSTGFAPMSPANLYAGCNNQLVVYGSFVADQINLMRSFGSLRDEIPNPGTPATPAGSQIGLAWRSWGAIPGMNCTKIKEPADPDTWDDNYLCLPSSSPIKLAWTSASGSSDNGDPNREKNDSSINIASLKSHGYPYCTQWNVPAEPSSHSWGDNWLCTSDVNGGTTGANPGLNFSLTNDPSQYCTPIIETADPDGNWANPGYFLCEPANRGSSGTNPTAKGPPYSCSNAGTVADINIKSCSGEVFEYSPELYLSNGGGTTQPPGGGSLQLQSITSLPPVL